MVVVEGRAVAVAVMAIERKVRRVGVEMCIWVVS